MGFEDADAFRAGLSVVREHGAEGDGDAFVAGVVLRYDRMPAMAAGFAVEGPEESL